MSKLEKVSHWFRGEQKFILFMKFNQFYNPLTKKQTQNEFKYILKSYLNYLLFQKESYSSHPKLINSISKDLMKENGCI